MEITYLNTDLEVRSKQDLSVLAEAFGKAVTVLYNGRLGRFHMLSLESRKLSRDPEKTIKHFCTLVESLPPLARLIWEESRSRTLDIGFDSGTSPMSLKISISSKSLKRAVTLGLDLAVTVYSSKKTSPRKGLTIETTKS